MQIAPGINAFSEIDTALYLDCPRCFYLALHHDIHRPYAAMNTQALQATTSLTEIAVQMQKVLNMGPPLQSPDCSFCNYRQRVRETGIENDLSG